MSSPPPHPCHPPQFTVHCKCFLLLVWESFGVFGCFFSNARNFWNICLFMNYHRKKMVLNNYRRIYQESVYSFGTNKTKWNKNYIDFFFLAGDVKITHKPHKTPKTKTNQKTPSQTKTASKNNQKKDKNSTVTARMSRKNTCNKWKVCTSRVIQWIQICFKAKRRRNTRIKMWKP